MFKYVGSKSEFKQAVEFRDLVKVEEPLRR